MDERSVVAMSEKQEDAGTLPPKKVLAALERVFEAEIDDRLPFQSKAKIFRDLCDDGLVQPMQRKFGTGWSAVTVSGYQLTHAGRFLYCATCGDEDTQDVVDDE